MQQGQHISGLTEADAHARRAQGQGNDARITTGRTYFDIARQNVFNLINVVLFSVGAVMIAIGQWNDAFVSVGLIVLNVIIGMFQEVRAKRQLDRIALLTRPRVTVRRDGVDRDADPAELVLGDVIQIESGDQIVVDGALLTGKLEVDESQLTGESDAVQKAPGDALLSGSFVVTGKGLYEATQVGAHSFAAKLTASARRFNMRKTPLQQEIDFIIRVLALLSAFIGLCLLIAAVLAASPLMRTVQMAAVVTGLIPNGLFFMVIVAYALGALRIVRQGVLVQQANSVESLSNINVLCMDKTGTLTANRIVFHDLRPLALDRVQVQWLLGHFARSISAGNRTSEAITGALVGEAHEPVDEVPFSSARKWSALAFDGDDLHGTFALGAPEMLEPYLAEPLDLSAACHDWTASGLRVLFFACNPDVTVLHDADGKPHLPPLRPLALLAFADELRPHLKRTLRGFINAGVELKIISGDNPDTVVALAKQAGFSGNLKAVSGADLAMMDEATFEKVANDATVFGRITPEQKERLVDALRGRSKYVAMMGDGVNDVLSLKKADIGIAMQSGSSATRGVADMVLLDDSFGALPPAFVEGQRIINGMQDILRLFLTRTFYVALLILATSIIGIGLPFIPTHVALLVFMTVAVPTFALALWARPGNIRRQGLLRSISHFVFPAAATIFLFGLLTYLIAFLVVINDESLLDVTPAEIAEFVRYTGIDYELGLGLGEDDPNRAYRIEVGLLAAQTALTLFTTLAGLILVIYVEPPIRWFVGGDVYSGDWRPTILALALMLALIPVNTVDSSRQFFQLLVLPGWGYAVIVAITLGWALTVRYVWRHNLFERFLGLDEPLRAEIDLSPQAIKKTTLITLQVQAVTMTQEAVRPGAAE